MGFRSRIMTKICAFSSVWSRFVKNYFVVCRKNTDLWKVANIRRETFCNENNVFIMFLWKKSCLTSISVINNTPYYTYYRFVFIYATKGIKLRVLSIKSVINKPTMLLSVWLKRLNNHFASRSEKEPLKQFNTFI